MQVQGVLRLVQGLGNQLAAAGAVLHMRLYLGSQDCLRAAGTIWCGDAWYGSGLCESAVARLSSEHRKREEPDTGAVITTDCV